MPSSSTPPVLGFTQDFRYLIRRFLSILLATKIVGRAFEEQNMLNNACIYTHYISDKKTSLRKKNAQKH